MIRFFQRFILTLGLGMVPFLTSLLASLLPGLEESDENLKKDIQEMIMSVNQ